MPPHSHQEDDESTAWREEAEKLRVLLPFLKSQERITSKNRLSTCSWVDALLANSERKLSDTNTGIFISVGLQKVIYSHSNNF